MAAIENNAMIIFDNGERKNVQSSVEQIKNEISGVTTHPLIKVTETDGEVVLINANHIREVVRASRATAPAR